MTFKSTVIGFWRCLLLSALFCAPAFAQQDVTPPQLVSLSFCPTAIDTTQNDADVYMTVGATDDLSGVLLIGATFQSPSFKQVVGSGVTESLISGTSTNGVFRFRVGFPRYSELGTYTLRNISLQDKVLNSVNIGTDTLRARGFSVQLINQAGASSQPCAGSSTAPLRITTVSLSSGVAGSAYLQNLAATGGVPPYSWTVSSGGLPPGLSLNTITGTITGIPTGIGNTSNLTIMVRDSTGATASTSLQLSVQPAPLSRVGSFAQVAYGEGWLTTLTLINLSTAPVNVQWRFNYEAGVGVYGDSIAPNGSLIIVLPIRNAGIHTALLTTGWVSVFADGPISGYGVVAWSGVCPDVPENSACPGNPYLAESIPFDTNITSSSFVLPLMDTGPATDSFRDAVAIANEGSQSTELTITAIDLHGFLIDYVKINLPGLAQRSFFLRDLFPQAQRFGLGQGIVKVTSSNTPITGTGLRFNPSGSFTSIPIIRTSN